MEENRSILCVAFVPWPLEGFRHADGTSLLTPKSKKEHALV
jgi:hypothetical protein